MPDHVVELARDIHRSGGVLLVVGGFVRDALLGRSSIDLDLEVFGVSASRCRRLLHAFGRTQAVGRAFPIWKWTPRGRVHDVKVHEAPLDLAANASERDLTINALYLDPRTGEILDPTGGLADLRAGRLRRVGESFAADPLRKLRLARFAWRTGFAIEPDTLSVARTLELGLVARERVFEEMRRVLLADDPLVTIPELWDRVGLGVDWPGFAHLVRTCGTDELGARLERARNVRSESADPFRFMLLVLTEGLDPLVRTAWIERILDPANARTLEQHADDLATLRAAIGPDAEVDRVALTLLARDGRAREARARWEAVAPLDPARDAIEKSWTSLGLDQGAPAPWVRGRDLIDAGWAPGPAFGEALEEAYRRQIDGRFASVDEARAWVRATPRPDPDAPREDEP